LRVHEARNALLRSPAIPANVGLLGTREEPSRDACPVHHPVDAVDVDADLVAGRHGDERHLGGRGRS
jgi:hypothetical protein